MMFTINPSPPTGRFAVGVTTYRLVDSTRREMFADDLTQNVNWRCKFGILRHRQQMPKLFLVQALFPGGV